MTPYTESASVGKKSSRVTEDVNFILYFYRFWAGKKLTLKYSKN
jgi:hypothetical protein